MTSSVIYHMIQEVAQIFNTTPSAIVSVNRKRKNVLARNMVADIAYSDFLFTYSEIGSILKRTHSTLIKNTLTYSSDLRARPELKLIRKKVLHNAQEYLRHLYDGYICD